MRVLPIVMSIFLYSFIAYACPPVFYNCNIIWNKAGYLEKSVPVDMIGKWKKQFGLNNISINRTGLSVAFPPPKKYNFKALESCIDFSPFFSSTRMRNANCEKTKSLYDCISNKALLLSLLKKYDNKTYNEIGRFHKAISREFTDWDINYDGALLMRFRAKFPKIKSKKEALSDLSKINHKLKKYVRGAHIPSSYDEQLHSEFEVFYLDMIPVIRHYDYGKIIILILMELINKGMLAGVSQSDLLGIKKASGGGRIVFYRAKGCSPLPNVVVTKNRTGWIATKNNCRIVIEQNHHQCPKIECFR